MNKVMFAELLESVKQAAAIVSGEMKPARVFEYPRTENAAHAEEDRVKPTPTVPAIAASIPLAPGLADSPESDYLAQSSKPIPP